MRNPKRESRIPGQWFTKAEADLSSAEILFREGGATDTVCFLCQQQEALKLAGEILEFVKKKI